MVYVFGYFGEVIEDDFCNEEWGLCLGYLVGKKGLEYNFDDEFRGSDGECVFVVDSWG